MPTENSGFAGLGISPEIFALLEPLQYTVPTPVQEQAIPVAVEGKDILGIAQTGTGKTLAFGIPMIQRLLARSGRALILVPTRELALQVDETIRKLGNPFDIRSVIVIGGMDIDMQAKLMKKPNIRVVIATPGRLMEHLEQKSADPSDLNMVVLDEADRMLDMGFAPQIERIARFLPKERQTLFFSATMPPAAAKMASIYLKEPVRVQVAPSGVAPEKIVQELFVVREEDKPELLARVVSDYKGTILIFTRTKAATWKLTALLKEKGHKVNELHSDRTQGQRRHALKGFKEGLYRVLVATDIAARGIDVQGIGLVINYDLPDETENYVHRIGRTGRAGKAGHAVTFATPFEGGDIRAIEAMVKAQLKVRPNLGVPNVAFRSKDEGKKRPVYENAERHKAGRPQFARPMQAPMRDKFKDARKKKDDKRR